MPKNAVEKCSFFCLNRKRMVPIRHHKNLYETLAQKRIQHFLELLSFKRRISYILEDIVKWGIPKNI